MHRLPFVPNQAQIAPASGFYGQLEWTKRCRRESTADSKMSQLGRQLFPATVKRIFCACLFLINLLCMRVDLKKACWTGTS